VLLLLTVVDPKLPAYKPEAKVAGTIRTEGSDTMSVIVMRWLRSFRAPHPGVEIEMYAKGSATAPVAPQNKTATFGLMSRAMTKDEQDVFEKAFGYRATQLLVDVDMVSIYVHRDNPVVSLTLAQVDAIFSKTRKAGFSQPVSTWGDLGVGGEWNAKRIHVYGRNTASGTYAYFKKRVLLDGDYKDKIHEMPGNAGVVAAVGKDPTGIGYGGIVFRTSDVRAVPLVQDRKPVAPVPANAYDGSYPLAHPLFVSLNYKPGSKLDSLRAEFLRYVFSREGQTELGLPGDVPVTATIAEKQLARVGLKP
jgi:phosphate transport system substrate-binding protein